MNNRIKLMIALFSIFLIIILGRLAFTILDDYETSSKIPLIEHNNLFTKEAQSRLTVLAVTTSHNRETTSNYVYDSLFNVFVLKVNLVNNSSLKNIISYKNESSHQSMNAVYSGLSNYNMEMSIKSGASIATSTLHFNFNGDFIKPIINNDSLYCYYYKFNTFSINYNDEPYDIIATANQKSIPASIVFKKQGKLLYIIIMTVFKGKEEMPPNQLYNIISK